jgi:excisionase family DNA binding protein
MHKQAFLDRGTSVLDADTTPDLFLQLFTIRDVCKKCAVGRTTIYAEIKAGRLKRLKIGRRTLVSYSALVEWLANLPDAAAPEVKGEVVQ